MSRKMAEFCIKKAPIARGSEKNLISYVKFVYLPSKAFTSSIMFSFT